MSDIETTKDLYRLYVRRFGDCPRTPHQAEYYRKWLDLLNSCSSNEEAEAKSKENGLYTAGAAAVALDRVYANKVAAEEMGWSDVADFCGEVIEKIKADPIWSSPNSRPGGWRKSSESPSAWISMIYWPMNTFVTS